MSETPDAQQTPTPEPGADQPRLHRLLSWRVMRRWLFAAACLATLIGLFYAVEDWRGRRAWEQCRRELEANGAVLDWNAYIPAPVPDEQNVFKAPKMTEWFVRGPWLDSFHDGRAKPPQGSAPFTQRQGTDPSAKDVLAAEVDVVAPTTASGSGHGGEVLRFEDPAARAQAAKLLAAAIGPCAEGPTACVIVARPLDQIQRAHLVIEAEAAPSLGALKALFTRSPVTKDRTALPGGDYLQVTPAGSNLFRLWLTWRVFSAADYLAWTQPVEADFDVMRQGLQRPFVRIEGDYQRPYERPIPDFVRTRTVAQMLSQRAQCYLLLGQPEAAWHELALVRDTCRLLGEPPTGNGTTLVEAMIDTAITGLYASIVQEGLRLQAWREPELAAIQKQLAAINLLPVLREAIEAERAASCRTFEITPRSELAELFSFGGEVRFWWDRLKDPRYLLLRFAPRGWLYQNMCAGAIQNGLFVSSMDIPKNQILPQVADGASSQLQILVSGFAPYTFLVRAALPNCLKAEQTVGRNQTLATESFLACGLERYRLAHGQYPETLEALVPQFAEKLPHDIIGGQSLIYHRTAEGRFVLYSVGWNERDDGGVPGKTAGEGDWVWQ